MSQVSTDKRSHLATLTGLPADTHVSTLERVFLETALGEEGPNLWLKYFKANGATAGQYNTAAREYLIAIGCTPASVSTMWAQAWREGLVGGGGGGAALAFHAATYDETTFEMEPVSIGVGSGTFSVDDGLLLPDADGVYVPIDEDTAPWHGARWDAGTAYADDGTGVLLPEIPSLYSAPAYTNLLLRSNNMADAAWTSNGTMTLNEVGLTGAANTATTVEDSNASTVRQTLQNFSGVANTDVYTLRVYVKKDSNTSRFPLFRFYASTSGPAPKNYVSLNTQTGATDATLETGTVSHEIVDGVDWWELYMSFTNASYSAQAFVILPAFSATLGGAADASLTGSIIVANAEVYQGKTIAEVRGSAPIITAGSTVSVAGTQSRFDKANADTDGPGVVYGEVAALGPASSLAIPVYSTGNNINTVKGQLLFNADAGRFQCRPSSTTTLAANVTGFATGTFYSGATAFSLADTSFYLTSGDNTDESTTAFDGWLDLASFILTGDTDDTDYGGVVLTRNLREYTAADYAEAKTTADDLVA